MTLRVVRVINTHKQTHPCINTLNTTYSNQDEASLNLQMCLEILMLML